MATSSSGSGSTPQDDSPSSISPSQGSPSSSSRDGGPVSVVGRMGTLPRRPFFLRILAVVSLCVGLWGAMSALGDINEAVLLDRTAYVVREKERRLMMFDQAQSHPESVLRVVRPVLEPFLKLPRAEIERLSLQLGDVLYARRGVQLPLGVLQLILCWLLLSGSLGTLRRQPWGVSTWAWACWASIPFSLLDMLVKFVHSRTLMARLGSATADALAQVSGRSRELELASLWQMTRLFVMSQAMQEGLGVLLMGVTALYLQRLRARER